MPFKLNVGGSKKIGEPNYGSRGASVNLELELDASLVADPSRLQEKIRQLFGIVRNSLSEELNGGNGSMRLNGHCESNGHHREPGSNGHVQGLPRPATQSQVKALYAICKRRDFDLSQILRDRFRIGRADELSIREASQLIDHLKSNES